MDDLFRDIDGFNRATDVVELICQFEIIFPPALFDVIMHLPIHLVEEIKFGGPVQYRWMYFIERYLGRLKFYVRNRSFPKRSIAEGYMMEECLTFISRYLREGVSTRLDKRCARKFAMNQAEGESSIFPKGGHPIGRKRKGKGFSLDFQSLKPAHRYILFNCNNATIEQYIK